MRDKLEPAALHPGFPASEVNSAWESEIAASQAISLKRIADALDGTAMGLDVSESLAGLPWAMLNGRLSR